jgi:membrane-bound ClpP family serine protease
MLGLLPLEKIPLFIWALILFVIGLFLAIHESFMTSGQLIDIGMVAVGAGVFFYDVKKRIGRSKNPHSVNEGGD